VVIEVGLARTEAALLLKPGRSVRSWACAWRLSRPPVVPVQIVAVRQRTVMRSNQEPARASKRAERW
jgi:hypothetical protein